MEDPVQLGPFALDTRIGSGGMGVVYRARHVETGEPVAIKTLLSEEARRPKKRRDFRREVQALATLHHPSIAAIVDYGQLDARTASRGPAVFVEDAPWFAMEYVEGRSLPTSIGRWSWEDLESVLLQTLDALAHAHARSIVHRDLKPGNILVATRTDTGTPAIKLVDFGIARLLDPQSTESRSPSNRVTGTPQYMSPEQIRGRWRDQGPWTDLYALGCLTWRLVCANPPFDGDTTEEVLKGHVRETPPPFDPVVPVPEGFEGWLRELLHRDVDRRTRRAADAAWRLLQLAPPDRAATTGASTAGPSASEQRRQPTLGTMPETVAAPDAPTYDDPALDPDGEPTRVTSDASTASAPRVANDGAPAKSASDLPPILPDWRRDIDDRTAAVMPRAGLQLFGLREVPVVDREVERDQLWSELHTVRRHGRPRLATLEGGTGSGKTRLAQWLCRRAQETGAATVLRASHTAASELDDGLREMVRRRFRTADLSRKEVFERLLDRLPSRGAGDEMRLADARALTELLRPTDEGADPDDGPRYRFSRPEQKYGLLRRLFERLAGPRPLIVWFDDLQWGPAAIGLLEAIVDMPHRPPPVLFVTTVRSDLVAEQPDLEERLDDLWSRTDARRLEIAPLAADDHRALIDRLLDLAPDLADRLAERTEGNPLFAIQLLRDWVDRGALEPGEAGFRLTDDHGLEIPETIHHLWLERLRRLLEDTEAVADEHGWFALEIAAALGRSVDRREWEAVLAESDVHVPNALDDRLVERGLAERTERGWAFTHGLLVESLARRAREQGRWREHHRRCAHHLASTPHPDVLGPRERIADHWIEAGDPEQALDPLFDEIALCRDLGQDEERRRLLQRRARLLDDLAIADDDPRRYAQTLERARLLADKENRHRARDLAHRVWTALDGGLPELTVRCAYFIGWLDQQAGDHEPARTWLHRALEAGRRTDHPRLRAQCHESLAWNYLYVADHDRADDHARRCREVARQHDDRYQLVQALRLTGFIKNARGDEDATDLFERSRQLAREAGYVGTEARALNGLGDNLRFDGRLDRARDHYRSFLRKMKELSRPLDQGTALLNLAQVDLRAGRFDDAADHLREAEARFEAIGLQDNWEGLATLIRLALAAGRRDAARFEQLRALLRDGWPEDWRLFKDHPWVLETAAEYAEEAGWDEEARALFELAEDLQSQLEHE